MKDGSVMTAEIHKFSPVRLEFTIGSKYLLKAPRKFVFETISIRCALWMYSRG